MKEDKDGNKKFDKTKNKTALKPEDDEKDKIPVSTSMAAINVTLKSINANLNRIANALEKSVTEKVAEIPAALNELVTIMKSEKVQQVLSELQSLVK